MKDNNNIYYHGNDNNNDTIMDDYDGVVKICIRLMTSSTSIFNNSRDDLNPQQDV